ncbi:nuclear transport factor 2 family protein [Thermomonospora amylolytica]|uniref:nuclear transport factor 2 family protein n=1 Tax=Thermomonospora amylolytica TaxID=1411117 RepID=UPI000E6C2519|nr:nuclear transport factor 2 family protein [Thermomonospora amylolytica]
MPTASEIVKRFYEFTQSPDPGRIADLLHPDIEVHTAPGLPCGAGGAFHGADAALNGVWIPVYKVFDTAPYDETWQETTDGTVVVTGRYRGTVRATGRAYEAEFVHLWRVIGDRLAWLHQYTDTRLWHEALAAPAP